LKNFDLGIIGLGVMGKSLARNFATKGYKVAVYNAPLSGEENVAENFINEFSSLGFESALTLTQFTEKLKTPRIVLLMIKAGNPVDQFIQELEIILEEGDIIIDAGNSYFKDSIRRYHQLAQKRILFVGMGVSGGETGALNGPALMPGGSLQAQEILIPMLNKISAKADGLDCVAWIASDGAGHFVKTIHNGIEYADMQIIAESYNIAKNILQLGNEAIADLLLNWNSTIAESYLLEISADILKHRINKRETIEEILDVAESKGTGLWTLQEAFSLGVPVPTIHAAITERIISGHKNLRVMLSKKININKFEQGDLSSNNILGAMIFARLVALAEGLQVIKKASTIYAWDIDIPTLVKLWRGGCIIRSALLLEVILAYKNSEHIAHLFQSDSISMLLNRYVTDARLVVESGLKNKIATPAISAALQYYTSMHSEKLPLNLVQAQRDYFGAHKYQKLDSGDVYFHTDWKSVE
jgi:6-phosphogluconate dehydrogenase